jgi:hypothetical protein
MARYRDDIIKHFCPTRTTRFWFRFDCVFYGNLINSETVVVILMWSECRFEIFSNMKLIFLKNSLRVVLYGTTNEKKIYRILRYMWVSKSKCNKWHFYEFWVFAPYYSHCVWLSKNIIFRTEDAFKLKKQDLESCIVSIAKGNKTLCASESKINKSVSSARAF